jgi:ATP-binding cassette subfamily C (CFTR/MRP) protein 4
MSMHMSEIIKPFNDDDLITPEEKIMGGITLKDYRNLFSFSVGTCGIFIILFLSILASLAQLFPSFVISAWLGQSFEDQ